MHIQKPNEFKEYIENLKSQFTESGTGTFWNINTGEEFTQAECNKFMKIKVEDYKLSVFAEMNIEASKSDIETDQIVINKRSKKPKSKKQKERYEGGDFNMVYRERMSDIMAIKLTLSERGAYSILRDLAVYPSNSVIINGEVPSTEQLCTILGIKERAFRGYVKKFQDNNIIKLVQSGHKKVIYINPEYYATGKDLSIDVLKMFNLIVCDDDKVNSYL